MTNMRFKNRLAEMPIGGKRKGLLLLIHSNALALGQSNTHAKAVSAYMVVRSASMSLHSRAGVVFYRDYLYAKKVSKMSVEEYVSWRKACNKKSKFPMSEEHALGDLAKWYSSQLPLWKKLIKNVEANQPLALDPYGHDPQGHTLNQLIQRDVAQLIRGKGYQKYLDLAVACFNRWVPEMA